MVADLTVHAAHSLQGTLTVPGDKSVSHRALLTGAIAHGATRIRNLLNADDVRATLKALQDLGVKIEMASSPEPVPSPSTKPAHPRESGDPIGGSGRAGEGGPCNDAWEVTVEGRGRNGLKAPSAPLEMGNSGTTARLLLGILAGCPFRSTLVGDESLSRRPMRRVTEPLARMGARFVIASEAKQSRFKGEIASSAESVPGPSTKPAHPRESGDPIGGSGRAGEGGPRNDAVNHLPLVVRGGRLKGIRYEMPVASAQVKSAILYAGLAASGPTTVVEPAPTRDHTERMLRYFGASLSSSRKRGSDAVLGSTEDSRWSLPSAPTEGGNDNCITVQPGPLRARDLTVPGDFSSAAFFLAAAAVVPGSSVTIRGVGLNPTRTAFLGVLKRMGAEVVIASEAKQSLRGQREIASGPAAPRNDAADWEPVGDVTVRYAPLKAVTVTPEEIPGLIDELPILMVAATQAEGTTVIEGAAELRVKETDRIRSMVEGLTNLGARIRSDGDTVIIEGPTPLKGRAVDSRSDHRTAMALAVAGLAAEGATTVRGSEWIRISFPGFAEALNLLRG